MKTKSLAALALAVAVLGTLAAGAGARPPRNIPLIADLFLRPHVGHHQEAVENLYGGFDGSYSPTSGWLAYSVEYRELKGQAIRIVVRSRATGHDYVKLCGPCHSTHVSEPNSSGYFRVRGFVRVDPDIAFLMANFMTFVQVNTTAYPHGEIGGPTYEPGPSNGLPQETPRCC